MKTKTIMILGLVSLCILTSCRCDFPSDEAEDKDKNKETQPFRLPDAENDSLHLSR